MPIIPKPQSCYQPLPCVLTELGKDGYSEVSGTGVNKVMIIGEALGENERLKARAFIEEAESGAILERALQRGGYDRQQFTLNNIVRCQPPNNKLDGAYYEHEAIEHCQPNFDREIKRWNPRCLLALGNIPLRTLTGLAGGRLGITSIRGFVLNSTRYGIPVVPSYHPSYINRGNKHLTGVLIRELGLAIEVASLSDEELEARRTKERLTNYVLHPSVDEAWSYARRLVEQGLPITIDIETPYSETEEDESEIVTKGPGQFITQIQFSNSSYSGIVFPYNDSFKPIIAFLLASELEKWGWNCYIFDFPILRKEGFIINGVKHDMMDAWHHLQPDLPRGLQYVTAFYAPWFGPWKHLSGNNLALYGAKDVDSNYRCGVGIIADLKARGQWDSYMKFYVRYQPILEATAARGIPVDREKQAELKAELQVKIANIDEEAKPLVPGECLPVKYHPKEGYKKIPNILAEAIVRETLPNVKGHTFLALGKDSLSFEMREYKGELKWFRKEVEDFNLNSSQQLINYIEFKGKSNKLFKVPTKRGSGKKTVEEEQLRRLYLKTNDKVLGLALDRKEMSHFVSAFCSPDWTPGEDGRIHTTYKSGGTAVMQLSAVSPNVLQFPKHGELAQIARRFIVAPEGYKIVTHDFKAFHAQTGSCEAGDAKYLRLAKNDIHSYVTAQFLKIPGRELLLKLDDRELNSKLGELKLDKNFKYVRDAKAKHAILGINNGMGVGKLYDKYREAFKSKGEAKQLTDLLRVEFPDFFQWQNDVRKLAHQQGFLRSKFGCVRYFWEVYKRYNGGWVSGESSEECIAYLLSNHAHCHMRERVIEMDDKGLLELFGLVNIIHDETVFICRDELVDRCLVEIPEIMSRASETIKHPIVAPNGLSIEVDSAVGQNWAAYHVDNNPGGMRGRQIR